MLRFEISPDFKARPPEAQAVTHIKRLVRRSTKISSDSGRKDSRIFGKVAMFVTVLAAPFIAFQGKPLSTDGLGELARVALRQPRHSGHALTGGAVPADPRIAREGIDYTATSATVPAADACVHDLTGVDCAPPPRSAATGKFLVTPKSVRKLAKKP